MALDSLSLGGKLKEAPRKPGHAARDEIAVPHSLKPQDGDRWRDFQRGAVFLDI
jgi:hypothetical protein